MVSVPCKVTPLMALISFGFFQCLTKCLNRIWVRNHSELGDSVLSVLKAYKAWGAQGKANYPQSETQWAEHVDIVVSHAW